MSGCNSQIKMLLAWRVLTNLKQYARLLCVLCILTFLPLIWLVTYPLRILANFILRRNANNGKLIHYIDGLLDEDFANCDPKSNIISTLELDGDITVEEVRKIFTKNVLDAKITNGQFVEQRYPEFKQYYTSFLGFRFRKNDPNFRLENHIRERVFDFCENNNDKVANVLDMSALHEQLVNEKFIGPRSPWELYVIRNVLIMDDLLESENGRIVETTSPKTVLALRMHHTMGDAKSILKLFVECLGQKPLKSASAQNQDKNFLQKTLFYGAFPIYYMIFLVNIFYLTCRSHLHQWKTPPKDEGKMAFKFSKRIYMDEIKSIAKRNGVTASSTLISVIAGAIRRFDPKTEEEGMTFGYILPKDNHPKHLTNHLYASAATLPTTEENPTIRLQKCQDIFTKMRTLEYCICGDFLAYLLGTLPISSTNPLMLNHCSPMAITNVAGEMEGFSVGGVPCSGFRLSVGVMPGCNGLVFCIFSYKDSLRIGLSGRESVINKHGVEKLMSEITREFEILKRIQKA